MGYKIFLFIMLLLIPAVMVGFGAYFMKRAPKKINYDKLRVRVSHGKVYEKRGHLEIRA